jgi:hypothetical protein
MSPDSSSFTSVSPSPSIPVMTTADTHMPLASVGSVVTPHLSLPNVYFISNLILNLASCGTRHRDGSKNKILNLMEKKKQISDILFF